MDWKAMDDSANPENKNAGNGGDLVKHTVYLATLRYLLAHKPWSEGLRLRECHAGRGVYRIPAGSRQLLSCLHSDPAAKERPVLLQEAQRSILGALGCWPSRVETLQWYAGSALINAFTLANNSPGLHSLDLYEWQPDTRQILRCALTHMKLGGKLAVSVLPAEEGKEEFDGERHIEERISEWRKQDVVLLDPFAMWQKPEHQPRRNRYGAILDALIAHGRDAPSLLLFWVWGQRHHLTALGNLNGSSAAIQNGYQELRAKLHDAGSHFVRVRWCCRQHFAIWVVAPKAHLTALKAKIDLHCHVLSDHPERRRCRLNDPRVEID